MLGFATAVFFLIVTPGPGVLSTAGVGASFGFRSGSRYVGGLFLGTNIVALIIVSGLGALILAEPFMRTLLFVLSFSYLTYLAIRIALAGSKLAFIERARPPGVLGGIILQLFNPKAYAVNTALFAGFAFLPENYVAEVSVKFILMNVIWIPIHFAWLWLGVKIHRLDLPEPTHMAINICMAASMMTVVILAIALQ